MRYERPLTCLSCQAHYDHPGFCSTCGDPLLALGGVIAGAPEARVHGSRRALQSACVGIGFVVTLVVVWVVPYQLDWAGDDRFRFGTQPLHWVVVAAAVVHLLLAWRLISKKVGARSYVRLWQNATTTVAGKIVATVEGPVLEQSWRGKGTTVASRPFVVRSADGDLAVDTDCIRFASPRLASAPWRPLRLFAGDSVEVTTHMDDGPRGSVASGLKLPNRPDRPLVISVTSQSERDSSEGTSSRAVNGRGMPARNHRRRCPKCEGIVFSADVDSTPCPTCRLAGQDYRSLPTKALQSEEAVRSRSSRTRVGPWKEFGVSTRTTLAALVLAYLAIPALVPRWWYFAIAVIGWGVFAIALFVLWLATFVFGAIVVAWRANQWEAASQSWTVSGDPFVNDWTFAAFATCGAEGHLWKVLRCSEQLVLSSGQEVIVPIAWQLVSEREVSKVATVLRAGDQVIVDLARISSRLPRWAMVRRDQDALGRRWRSARVRFTDTDVVDNHTKKRREAPER